jgi:tripartite-type tricarboxylate transporter receptor subunit TctC
MRIHRRDIARWLMAAAITAGTTLAIARPFTDGVVTIVVPGPAGSSFDNAARLVAEPLAKEWGIPVIVENKPGASMTLGATQVVRAPADGRTLFLGATPYLQAPHLLRNVAYDPVASFTPLVQMFDARLWFAINAALPARSVEEFVALARKPGSNLSYATPGNGSTPHLNAALLMQQARLDMLHVPYKGIPPAVTDVVAGQVSSVFASYSDLAPHAAAGKLRILASTGAERSALSKDVPTFKELGYTGLEVVGFGGLLVRSGTPAPLVAELAASIQKVMARPDIRARLTALGVEPVSAGPQAFAKTLREQNAFWKKLITDFRITAD